jgi:hypothetical protein
VLPSQKASAFHVQPARIVRLRFMPGRPHRPPAVPT